MNKQILVLGLVITQCFSSIGYSDVEINRRGININSFSISSDAIIGIGSVLTISSEREKVAVVVGWTLIVFGSLIQNNGIAYAAELNNSETELAVYGEGYSAESPQYKANISQALKNTEMEALIASHDASLASNLAIGQFASSLEMEPAHLGKLIESAKLYADSKLKGAQFGQSKTKVDKSEIALAVNSTNESDLKVVTNYLNLRNITVL